MLSDDKGYFWVLYLIYVGILVVQVSPSILSHLMHTDHSPLGGDPADASANMLCPWRLTYSLLPGYSRTCTVVSPHLQMMSARLAGQFAHCLLLIPGQSLLGMPAGIDCSVPLAWQE